jgi:hypothetical protein
MRPWLRPSLVVLARTRAEERALGSCKMVELGPGGPVAAAQVTCDNDGVCFPCHDPAAS